MLIIEPWLWIAFIAGVVALIVFDLAVLQRGAHVMKPREAVITSAVWVGIALLFNAWFGWRYGAEHGVQFLTGYLVEESLSIDNLFVMLLIFQALKIPPKYQHRVLFWGIMGAMVLRGGLIIAGVRLVQEFEWILYIFGGILLVSAVKFLIESDSKQEVTRHWSVRLVHKIWPITHEIEGHHLFVRRQGRTWGTPLLVALIVIEVSDLIFAVDSIPAVFAVTTNAFIAFSSNVLAILGLRSLYFVIADWVGKLRYLKPGLAAVLGFVGIKMLIVKIYPIPSWVSLIVLIGILSTAGLTSWYVARDEK